MSNAARPTIIAGVPLSNMTVYHRIRFKAGDPAAVVTLGDGSSILVIRDIEMERARAKIKVDRVTCPKDWAPFGDGVALSGDRPTATAQAAAECVVRAGLKEIWTDRSLPMIFAHHLMERGVAVRYDPTLGVMQRRRKDAQEVEWMRAAQRATEGAIEMACRWIAGASARKDGVLMVDGAELTSERVMGEIDVWLLKRGYGDSDSIIAGGPMGGDCHERGRGVLRTEEPVIVDVFPRSKETLYVGDCTRMVVHGPAGNIPKEVLKMHAAVKEAKDAAIAAMRAGTTGDAVHRVVIGVMSKHGYPMGLPKEGDPATRIAMVHGTGHGLGLELKEPPLLDVDGPELLEGDAITVEPGLYGPAIGGMRLEDMVIVGPPGDGVENLNVLEEGLTWG
ncbi:MAG: M24 family metallopeptidase [Phycisphaerales bacterium]